MAGRKRRRRVNPWHVALIVAAVATFGAAGYVVFHQDRPSGAGEVIPYTEPPQPPQALFLGDSYTSGVGATRPTSGYAETVADKMGWTYELDAQGGTGFVNAGHVKGDPASTAKQNFVQRAAHYTQNTTDPPTVTIIAGGFNDVVLLLHHQATLGAVSTAIGKTVSEVRQAFPRTRIVIVGTWWPTPAPPPAAFAVDAAQKRIAAAGRAVFVDPIGEHWVTAANEATVIGPDGTHPTQAGHDYLASRLVADLRRLGV